MFKNHDTFLAQKIRGTFMYRELFFKISLEVGGYES